MLEIVTSRVQISNANELNTFLLVAFLEMKFNVLSKSKRLFSIARLQGMFCVVIDSSQVARPSTILLFYSIACALFITITLQWSLYKLFVRLYSNTKQEVVLTVLVTSKYTFLDWKIIFGYFCQIFQRKDIANVINEAWKIEKFLIKFRLNRHDDKYQNWCAAKAYSNWFQVISINCSFIIGCLLYSENVSIGDVIVFSVTTYCQIMPTIVSSMYFFFLCLSFKFYRAINRKIHILKCEEKYYYQIDQINFLFDVATKYTENVCKLFSTQILAALFNACALILVEVH